MYPAAQPSLKHDLPLWLEEEEEDEIYSSQIYTLETAIGGGPPDEDELIEHIMSPNTMSLEEVVKETKDNH